MMRVLIAEDEDLAAERLQEMLLASVPEASIVNRFDSVEELVAFFRSGRSEVDLLMLDIQLADGKIFELFEKVYVEVPVIFITAFDQYALQAFKVLSVDYLLKPVQPEDLRKALEKFKKFLNGNRTPPDLSLLSSLTGSNTQRKERLLIKAGNKLVYRNINDAAYFFAEGKSVYMVPLNENRKLLIDYTLEELESTIDPKRFFRASRKFIINIEAIQEIKTLIGSRYEIKTKISEGQPVQVSRERAQDFKMWLDQ